MNNKENYKKAVDQIHASPELKEKTFEKTQEKKKVIRPRFTRYLAACAVFVAILAVGGIYFKGGIKDEEEINQPKVVAQVNNDLPRFESMEQLKEAIGKKDLNDRYYTSGLEVDMLESATTNGETKTVESSENDANDFSRTNTQVEGVDEADIVKTDGNFIYYVSQGKVFIINAQSLKIESTIESESNQNRFYPTEIFINDDKLVILGNAYEYEDVDLEDEDDDVYYSYYGRRNKQLAKAKVYNISNRKSPKVEREVALDGMYKTSRMIGDNVYFISSKGVYYYNGVKDVDLLPVYEDTAVSTEIKSVDYSDIAYFEGTSSHSYLMVAGFNINKKEPASTETFFGASEDVYASTENLYITQSYYKYFFGNDITKSKIYKFKLKDSKVILQASNEIKGTVNNQFSMDEYEGKLRIATTSNEYDEDSSKSQVIVLDENLNEIGRIGNMAKGEKIYSVRFVGKVGYVVTFRQIDPLFVIDLSDPYNPEIKGELKIPGYSAYLHPYDETHIIGIGYNTKTNMYGNTTNENMKMSMFDVSDLENPKEMFNVDIGNSQTYSEITTNHKALFYNKEKKLIGFPVNEWGYSYKDDKNIFPIYKIDLDKGFVEYGKIEQERDWKTSFRRAIYIKDTLYTLADYKIIAYSLDNLEKLDELELQK